MYVPWTELTPLQYGPEIRLVCHQRLGRRQHNRLCLARSTTSRSRRPHVVPVQTLRLLQCPDRTLSVVQTAKIFRKRLAVHDSLASTLHHVHRRRAALSPSRCPCAAVVVDNDGFGLVEEGLQDTLEPLKRRGHLFGHQRRVDVVQALDDLQQAVVSGLLNRLVHFRLVLLPCLPCYSGRLARRTLRQELVFAKQC